MKSEKQEGCQTRWIARILDKIVYALHEIIVVQLQLCLEMNDTPDRLKKKLKANL